MNKDFYIRWNGMGEDMVDQPLTDVQIDEINMSLIDKYLEAKKEYQEQGYWTGFMGAQVNEHPKEPRLLRYSWEGERR